MPNLSLKFLEITLESSYHVFMTVDTVVSDTTGEILAHEYMEVDMQKAIILITRNPAYYGPLFRVYPRYLALIDSSHVSYWLAKDYIR